MVLKSLKDIDIQGKIVLYRAPYDIEVIDGKLEDTKRIDFTIPTLNYLLAKHCKVVIVTYVGRPDGKVVESLKTTFHAKYLSDKLNINIKKLDDCIGKEVTNAVEQMKAGEVLMLENVRFYKEEVEDDDDFAIKLCGWADIIVFDAFPQAHRKHASTTGILRHKEIQSLCQSRKRRYSSLQDRSSHKIQEERHRPLDGWLKETAGIY